MKTELIKEISQHFENLDEKTIINPMQSIALDDFTRTLSDKFRLDEQTRSELLEGMWNIYKTIRKVK